jgi:hypothetical protein
MLHPVVLGQTIEVKSTVEAGPTVSVGECGRKRRKGDVRTGPDPVVPSEFFSIPLQRA